MLSMLYNLVKLHLGRLGEKDFAGAKHCLLQQVLINLPFPLIVRGSNTGCFLDTYWSDKVGKVGVGTLGWDKIEEKDI